MSLESRTAIGVDLGTTYSVVAFQEPNGEVRVLRNDRNSTKTPSVVWFADDEIVVGDDAKEELKAGACEVASFFKRSMGDSFFLFSARGRDYSATELSAFVLKELKSLAEKELERTVTDAVVTVPAYFNNPQREATIEAAQQAGLNVLRIVNEPTAAALAYGANATNSPTALTKNSRKRYLVYDLGGGTFDVSIIEIAKDEVKVLATDGDHRLGGKDWDDRIRDYAAERFQEETGLDLFDDLEAANEALVSAEKAKIALSDCLTTRFSVSSQGETTTVELSRDAFEADTADLLERTENICEAALASCSPPISWENLDGVLLVGGSTRIPAVRKFARRASGLDFLSGVNVDEAVAVGAAIQAAFDLNEALEQEKDDKNVAFAANVDEPEPDANEKLKRKAEDEQGQSERRSDERTPGNSFDDASKKTELKRSTRMRVLKDVMSHSLGTIAENQDHSKYVAAVIIRKNIPIPADETRPFRLRVGRGRENAAELEVYILQGESENPRDNLILGRHVFSGFESEPSGYAEVEVAYRYNRNGIVETFATQTSCKKQLKKRVEPIPNDMSWLDEPPKNNVEASVEPLSIVFAIDVSGSMRGEPLEKAIAAIRQFLTRFELGPTKIGVVAFSEFSREILPLTDSLKEIESALARTAQYVWGNNVSDPFYSALKLLASRRDEKRFIFVLTDGCWNCYKRAVENAQTCKNRGIEIVALGFGSADKSFLQKIASSTEGAVLSNVERLSEGFSTIAQVIESK